MSSKDFTKGLNPFFLFRESLKIAFDEYDQHTQRNRSESVRSKPDASTLSKIVSRLWKKLPPSVRKGWELHAKHNRVQKIRKAGRPMPNIGSESESDGDDSSPETLSSETMESSEDESSNKGVTLLVFQLIFS